VLHLVPIYAAIISTSALLWQIRKARRSEQVVVWASIGFTEILDGHTYRRALMTDIVNDGAHAVAICALCLLLDGEEFEIPGSAFVDLDRGAWDGSEPFSLAAKQFVSFVIGWDDLIADDRVKMAATLAVRVSDYFSDRVFLSAVVDVPHTDAQFREWMTPPGS
jgi:hypothetical protein